MSIENDEKVVALPRRKKPEIDGPLQVVRSHGGCQHRHTLIDEKKAEVTCSDCGEKINPIWLLMELASEDRMLRDRWANMRAEVKLLGERVRTKCLHCGKMTPIRSNATGYQIYDLAEKIKRGEE